MVDAYLSKLNRTFLKPKHMETVVKRAAELPEVKYNKEGSFEADIKYKNKPVGDVSITRQDDNYADIRLGFGDSFQLLTSTHLNVAQLDLLYNIRDNLIQIIEKGATQNTLEDMVKVISEQKEIVYDETGRFDKVLTVNDKIGNVGIKKIKDYSEVVLTLANESGIGCYLQIDTHLNPKDSPDELNALIEVHDKVKLTEIFEKAGKKLEEKLEEELKEELSKDSKKGSKDIHIPLHFSA